MNKIRVSRRAKFRKLKAENLNLQGMLDIMTNRMVDLFDIVVKEESVHQRMQRIQRLTARLRDEIMDLKIQYRVNNACYCPDCAMPLNYDQINDSYSVIDTVDDEMVPFSVVEYTCMRCKRTFVLHRCTKHCEKGHDTD